MNWLRRGGWAAFIVVLSAVLHSLIQFIKPGSFAQPAYQAVLLIPMVLMVWTWVMAFQTLSSSATLKWPSRIVAFSACAALGFVSFLPTLFRIAPPWMMPLFMVTGLLSGPLIVLGLLMWPRSPGDSADKRYLAVDFAIILLSVALFVHYLWFRPSAAPGADQGSESWFVIVLSAAMLAGLSAAALRRPAPEVAVPFTLLLAWAVIACVTNSAMTLFGLSPAVTIYITVAAQAVLATLSVMAAEAIRLRWQWPGKKALTETSNPVPWVAVGAIAIFVLKIGIDELDTGIGPVVIGGVVAMLLLVARQAMTMRHNAELQAERAALLTDAKIAALVRHTSDVIMIADESLRVRYVSPSAESLWGRPASELLGLTVVELVEVSNRAAIERLLTERLAQPGQTDSTRWRVTGRDGSTRRVEAVVTSLLHEPSVQGVVITLRDQTDRIHLEEQLNQSQKMEAVGQLAGGVAHDFNNLLTTILGHTEVGLDMLDEGHPVREDLTQIKRASELAASLTRQLLAFSRKQVIEPRVVDVAVSLEQVVRLLRRLIKEHVTTVLEVGADLGRIRVDPSHLEQVVLNLAVNARDAMPQGGTLTIRAREETITAQIPDAVVPVPLGDCVIVEVIDTGTGMDAATQARIFEPFFTTKPPGRGTGLGLASVYGVVKQSGAGMVVRSAPGRGSSFSVYFPRVAALMEVTPATAPAQAQARFAATILLCEDETALREIAHKVLAREGYRVLVASEAEEALTLAASAPFPIDLLLSDVVMPGMSGPVLAQKLKAARPGVRVLLMSGYPGDDLTGELKPDQRFLRKPFTPFVLLEHVRAALAGLGDPAPTDSELR